MTFLVILSTGREKTWHVFCLNSTRLSVLFAPRCHIISVSRLFVRRHSLSLTNQPSANHCFHNSCRLLDNEETEARQKIFGAVIDLRCGDCNPIARDGPVIGCGAAPELMNLISTFTDVTCTF